MKTLRILCVATGIVFLAIRPIYGQSLDVSVSADQALQENRQLDSLGGIEMIPVGGEVSTDERGALLAALDQYWSGSDRENFTSLEQFLQQNPNTAYRAALLINLGYLAYHYGYYSRAVDFYEKAWALTKALPKTDSPGEQKVIADAGVKLAGMYSRLGRRVDLENLLHELDPHPKWGADCYAYQLAELSAVTMKMKPEHAFNCGPFALWNIAKTNPESHINQSALLEAKATPDKGFSLAQLESLAKGVGLHLQAVRRNVGAEIPLPAVVHWKSGHYAAILEEKNGYYHVKDPTFLADTWISSKALNEESSGLFLIPFDSQVASLPNGWQSPGVDAQETFGRGILAPVSETDQSSGQVCQAPTPVLPGMAAAGYNGHDASAYVIDTPVAYTPPIGPSVTFQLSYYQDQVLSPGPGGIVGNGSLWTMNYFSAVQDNNSTVAEFTSDGRIETYTPDNSTLEIISGAAMERVTSGNTTTGFKEHFQDGSEWDYMQRQSGNTTTPYYFLTKIIDAQGNNSTLTYDGSNRLTKVTDALGQNTTLTYGNVSHTTWLTGISDPFGRTANLTYDGSGRLLTITDPVGIVSSFTYSGANITTMTTPYGNTTIENNFENYPVDGSYGVTTLLITDPTGARERVSFSLYSSFLPFGYTGNDSPNYYSNSYNVQDSDFSYNVSEFFDKHAMDGLSSSNVTSNSWLGNALGSNAYWQLGTQTKWLLDPTWTYSIGVPASVKPPLENRIYYLYENQPSNWVIGTFSSPGGAYRVVQDETGTDSVQVYQYTHNALGELLTATDPLGRVTTYTYGANHIDLTTVQQGSDTVATYANYTNHLPGNITDAAGAKTQLTYNGTNHLLIESQNFGTGNTALRTTYYNRDANGYVSNITVAGTGITGNAVTAAFTYANGLVQSASDARGFTTNYTYDGLQRVTAANYTDGTSETWNYTNTTINGAAASHSLSLSSHTDRQGQTTTYTYDGDGHALTVTDPGSRITSYDWCGCGALESITDASGRTTSFNYDIESRLTSKTISTGSENNAYTYTYQPECGRLASIGLPNDGGNATVTYEYNLDNSIASQTYSNSTLTPNVSFTYDSTYARMTSMTDGAGTSNYTYGSVGSAGALQLASANGPWANDTLHYDYDGLGRMVDRQVLADNSTVLQDETYIYDALDRATTLADAGSGGNLGNFTLGYSVGNSSELTSVAYPNGINVTLGYLANANGALLANITNNYTTGNTTTLFSRFDYARRNDGLITAMQQQFGWAPAVTANVTGSTQKQLYTYAYDGSNWLTGAKLGAAANTTTLQDTYENSAYAYDGSGNPTSSTVNLAGWAGNYNSANEMTDRGHSGPVRVTGFTNEPTNVTVNSAGTRKWSMPGGQQWFFESLVDMASGTGNVSIVATDAVGNSTTQVWKVNAAGSAAENCTYDASGDRLTETTEPGTSMAVATNATWDCVGRLIFMQTGPYSAYFTYDGLGRRVEQKLVVYGSTINDEHLLWDGDQIVQKRAGGTDSSNIVKKYFNYGYQTISGNTATNYFYTKDNLGSIREVIANDGHTVEGRFSYDPWGGTTYLDYTNGSIAQPDFAYAGYSQWHYVTDAYFTRFRVYEPSSHQWLSRDSIGEKGGLNLYGYAGNDPINFNDPEGLAATAAANCPDPCKDLAQKIKEVRDELAKRANDLRTNPLNLPATGPMSVAGHQQQFGNKQTQLRDLLNQFGSNKCGDPIPSDAWSYATMPTPAPAPKPAPRVPYVPVVPVVPIITPGTPGPGTVAEGAEAAEGIEGGITVGEILEGGAIILAPVGL